MRPKTITLVILVILCEIILVSLGMWQLRRLEWKEALLAEIATQSDKAPKNIDALNLAALQQKTAVFQPVIVTGRPVCNAISKLGIRSYQGVPGYHVAVPLQLEMQQILVLAGWINTKRDNWQPDVGFCNNLQTVNGILIKPPKPNRFTPKPNQEERLWYALSTTELNKQFDIKLLPLVIKNTETTLQGLVPLDKNISLSNRHLEYALTWFSFAGILLVISVILLRKPSKIDKL